MITCLVSEDSGIVWAAEPEKDFFINFIEPQCDA